MSDPARTSDLTDQDCADWLDAIRANIVDPSRQFIRGVRTWLPVDGEISALVGVPNPESILQEVAHDGNLLDSLFLAFWVLINAPRRDLEQLLSRWPALRQAILAVEERYRDIMQHWKRLDDLAERLRPVDPESQLFRDLFTIWGEPVHLPLTLLTGMERAVDGLEDLLNRYATAIRAGSPSGADPPAVIISLGGRQYQVGNGLPIIVTDNEDTLLQAFGKQPTMDDAALRARSGLDSPAKVLRDLRGKYNAAFATAIRTPGRKGGGGYHAVVKSRA
jgi:hypothetical protein